MKKTIYRLLDKENSEYKKRLDLIQKEKNNYYNKYHEELLLNEKLTKELYNNKNNLDMIKKKSLDLKKNKNNVENTKKRPISLIKKKELIKDLQKKIDNYRYRTLRNSYMDMDDFTN